ncbi:MAG: DUF1499 domain-containing protein [Gammaproteobacteria bacterium]|nr:DUF1499 domain-containing protein [Gammaproteobacteria bacterium]MBU1439687.1 DUF1499 domain-containing protein [Gammaproteobacteria bacterium]MBU2289341.1 DUF1499 domain-containing protein [Gammaproteobacteria bacterium]MBU2407391.1 DUF1499 domain-containing protein [Gammaproteobacteria bacterium]
MNAAAPKYLLLALVTAFAAAGCASQSPAVPDDAPSAATRAALACTLPSNCVNSTESGLPALRYQGTREQGMAVLRATLASYAEARVVSSDAQSVTAIFSTPLGFQDKVEFIVDPDTRRIDFRSASGFGLYDLGKNRSRMRDFATRFAKQQSSR